MFESWFTQKCMAFVNESGKMLSKEDAAAAETAVRNAELENLKIWTDNNGICYVKKRSLFSSAEVLLDANGNQVRFCNHRVNNKARFCSKCGAPAPGGWWKCSGCGEMIGNDSDSCPHCGKDQSISSRQHLSDGTWVKDEEVLAQYIDIEDAALKMQNGLNVFPHQCCVFLAGGKVVDILAPGTYSDTQLKDLAQPYGGSRSIVMIDKAEFPIRMCVEKLRSKENIETDLHVSMVLRFDTFNVNSFLQNFMGSGLTIDRAKFSHVVVYDEVARRILQFSDMLIREFCTTRTIKEFFCDSTARKGLEAYLAQELFEHLKAAGMSLVRIGEVEFESEVFEALRQRAGELEVKRRELEFIEQVRDMENDAKRREINSEAEMEDFLRESARNKKIREQLVEEELAHLERTGKLKKEIAEVEFQHDLQDAQLKRESQSRLSALNAELEEYKKQHESQIEKRRCEQQSLLEEVKFEDLLTDITHALELKKQGHGFIIDTNEVNHSQKIETLKTDHRIKINKAEAFANDEIREHSAMTDIKIESEHSNMALDRQERENKIELDRLEKLIQLKNLKHAARQESNIQLLQAAQGADLATLLMVTDDPARREQLLKLHAQSQWEGMSVERILAAGVVQGNKEASAVLQSLSKDKNNSNDEK